MDEFDQAVRRAADLARAGTLNGRLILTDVQWGALERSGIRNGVERLEPRPTTADDVPVFHGVEILDAAADLLGPCVLCGTHHPATLCPHGRVGG